MLTPELQARIAAARQNVTAPSPNLGSKIAAARSRVAGQQPTAQPTDQPGAISSFFAGLKKVGTNIIDDLKKRGDDMGHAIVRPSQIVQQGGSVFDAMKAVPEAGLRAAGAVAGGLNDIVSEPISAAVQATPQPVKDVAVFLSKAAMKAQPYADIAEKAIKSPTGQSVIQKIKDAAQAHPELTKDVEAGLNIATLIPGAKVAGKGAEVAAEGVGAAKTLTADALKARAAKNAAEDAIKVDHLAGKIVQGSTDDVARARRALADLNVDGVKTYQDLTSRLNEKIKNYSTKLDATLETNPVTRKLPDLAVETKVGGDTIAHNYVEDSITQLHDLYTKVNDPVSAQRMSQLAAKAQSEGLTIKELNDLAKEHGIHLNAFNANGQAASGLSKQAAENTRKGVKATGRHLFGDKVYESTDKAITDLIRTRDLTSTMAENVNKLTQKIQKRGLGERVGYLAGKIINIAGAGGPKGLVEAFLSRGTGLKTLNALDLEAGLQKNLKLLQKLDATVNSGLPTAEVEKRLQEIIDANGGPND